MDVPGVYPHGSWDSSYGNPYSGEHLLDSLRGLKLVRRFSTLFLVLILSLSLLVLHPLPLKVAGDSSVLLSVFSEDSSSPNLVDPTFTLGSSFNFTVQASNIPPVADQGSGGLSGFDVTLAYNASVLKTSQVGFSSPFCPISDGCIFDMPKNDTMTTSSSLDSPPGTMRFAIVVLGPSHRASLPSLPGQPAILFRVTFQVVGKGVTSVNIQQASSELVGFASGCGSLLSFNVQNGSFDNREPFRVSASPPSGAVNPGQILSVLVNVSRVNSAGDGDVNLTLSGLIPSMNMGSPAFVFAPKYGSLDAAFGLYSFTSTLKINTTAQSPLGSYTLAIIGVIPAPAVNTFQYNRNFTLTIDPGPYVSPTISTIPQAASQPARGPQASSVDPVQQDLLASFNVSSSPIAGSTATFIAVAVWCSTSPYAIHWDFGDGSSSTSNPASPSYSSAGTFTVTLTVTDMGGNTHTSARAIAVNAAPQSPPPLNTVLIESVILLILVLVAGSLFLRRRGKHARRVQ